MPNICLPDQTLLIVLFVYFLGPGDQKIVFPHQNSVVRDVGACSLHYQGRFGQYLLEKAEESLTRNVQYGD